MAGMSTSDVVAPSAELARAQLAQAIAIKRQMADGPCPELAVQVAQVMIRCLRAGGKVIFFGNGGSAQDAGHLAAELMGRFAFDRPGLAAFSLPDATAAMTAIGNDYSYDEVFARQVLATVALTGAHGGKAAALAQIPVRVPADDTARVQEACLHLGHTICEMVEAALFARPS